MFLRLPLFRQLMSGKTISCLANNRRKFPSPICAFQLTGSVTKAVNFKQKFQVLTWAQGYSAIFRHRNLFPVKLTFLPLRRVMNNIVRISSDTMSFYLRRVFFFTSYIEFSIPLRPILTHVPKSDT